MIMASGGTTGGTCLPETAQVIGFSFTMFSYASAKRPMNGWKYSGSRTSPPTGFKDTTLREVLRVYSGLFSNRLLHVPNEVSEMLSFRVEITREFIFYTFEKG